MQRFSFKCQSVLLDRMSSFVELQLKRALRYRTKQYWENHYAAKAKVSDAVTIVEEDIRYV